MRLPVLLVFFHVLSFAASNFISNCPDGYTKYSVVQLNGNYNYACYKNFLLYYTRQAAEARCAQDGAFLPSITSEAENQNFIRSNTYTSSVFIGLSCYDTNDCGFDDGTPFNSSSYSGFRDKKIRYDAGECVILHTVGVDKGLWSNVPCSMLGSFVCKYTPDSQIALSSGCNSHYDTHNIPFTITSPFYPSMYQPDMTCVYSVAGNVNITFLDFQLNKNDFLRIYDGGHGDPDRALLGIYSGSTIPPSVATSKGSALIIFDAYSMPGRGFKAVFGRKG